MKKYVSCLGLFLLMSFQLNAQSLIERIRAGDWDQVRKIANRDNVNQVDKNQASPLMWAVYKADLNLVRFLVDLGADLHIKGTISIDNQGSYYGSLVGIAAAENKLNILQYLLEVCQIPVDDREWSLQDNAKTGWTALQWAANTGRDTIVTYLINKGADIDFQQTPDAGTPLLYTLQNQYYSTALLLLHSGANPNLKNSNGWSPLHFTASDGQMELTELLIEKGARIDEKDADSWTPLMLAAYMGNNNIYDYLLLHGADKELKNKDGNAASILTDRYFDSIEYNRKLMYQYKNSGDYEKAILYAQKVLLHLEKEYGTQHEEYATALNNLAFLYSNLGDYSTAEPLYKKALDIRKKVLGVEHPDYARSLNSLAELYYYMGNYAAAEPLFKQALEIRKKSLGAEHPDYATSLNNLAALYYEMGNYPAAEPLYQQALEIKKKALGVEHPDYATSLNNLAALYERMGNYPAAEPMYQQALEIRKKVLGEEHPGYARSLNSLAALFISNGQPKKAEPYMLAANDILLNQLNIGYQFLSEAEAQLYYTTIAYQFEINNSFIVGRGKDNPSLATLSLNNELALKGASLQASIRMRQSIQDSGDSVLIGTFNQWIGIKIRINDQNNLPIIKRTANVDSLETVANTLEKDLIRSSQVFKGLQASLGIQWKDVQNRLLEKEAAIEFINFQYHNGKKWTDSTQYVALIVRPGDEYPQFINLFEEKQLYEILYYADAPKGRQIRRAITPEIMLQVYELAWQPIEKYLSGVNTVYLSPSGLLTTIPFQALMKDNTTCLIDSLDIQYLLSTRELAIEKPMKESAEPLTAALFGGIRYDLDTVAMNREARQSGMVATRSYLPNDSTRGITSFRYLEGTMAEVKQVNGYLTSHDWKTRVFTDSLATEAQFKRLDGKNAPTILHIATHGFYFPPQESQQKDRLQFSMENRFRAADNPLRRTGLILAGANRAWKNEAVPNGVEDGILTAYEISNMDLRKTGLVVLSACETGLGDIKRGEGVFGLQRAFRLAGVQTIIMSLWNVDDKTTTELMSRYFQYWMNGEKRVDAFNRAVSELRGMYKDEPGKWAAFVMVE